MKTSILTLLLCILATPAAAQDRAAVATGTESGGIGSLIDGADVASESFVPWLAHDPAFHDDRHLIAQCDRVHQVLVNLPQPEAPALTLQKACSAFNLLPRGADHATLMPGWVLVPLIEDVPSFPLEHDPRDDIW